MTQLFSDNFTRANSGTLGANWTKLSGFNDLGITANVCKATNAADNADAATGVGAVNTDQWAQCTIGTFAEDGGPAVRMNTTSTFYFLDLLIPASINLCKFVSGAFTQIATATGSNWVTTDVAYIEFQGSNYVLKQNGTSRLTGSDGSIDGSIVGGPYPGIFISNTNLTFSGFAMGDFSSGTGALPTLKQRGYVGVYSEPSIEEYKSTIARAKLGIVPGAPRRPFISSSAINDQIALNEDKTQYINRQFRGLAGTAFVPPNPIIGKTILSQFSDDPFDFYTNAVSVSGPAPGIGLVGSLIRPSITVNTYEEEFWAGNYNQIKSQGKSGVIPQNAQIVTKVFITQGLIAEQEATGILGFPKMFGVMLSRPAKGIIPSPSAPGIVTKGGYVGVSVRVGGS